MAAEKPAIVVFAGAYHKSSCMRLFIDSLRQAGFEADSYSLASIEDSTKAVDDDEVVIRSETEKRVENGRDVLLILHSFAGFGGSAAMSGLDKKTRAEYKQPNGLVGVIFLVAFIPLEGETVLTILDSPHPSTIIREEEGLVEVNDGDQLFYNDCAEDVAQAAKAELVPHSLKAFATAPSKIGWREPAYDGHRAYIRCLQDRVLPLEQQDKYLTRTGVHWNIKTMSTSHSPFLSKPDDLISVVAEILKDFLG